MSFPVATLGYIYAISFQPAWQNARTGARTYGPEPFSQSHINLVGVVWSSGRNMSNDGRDYSRIGESSPFDDFTITRLSAKAAGGRSVCQTHLASARNAAALTFVGAILWLARLPGLELGPFGGQVGDLPQIDVVVATPRGIAILGLTAIAAGTAIDAILARRRSIAVATFAMIAGLAILVSGLRLTPDSALIHAAAIVVFATGWVVLAAATRSLPALFAASALMVFGVGFLPGSPLADFVRHQGSGPRWIRCRRARFRRPPDGRALRGACNGGLTVGRHTSARPRWSTGALLCFGILMVR